MRLKYLLVLTTFYCLIILWAVQKQSIHSTQHESESYVEQEFNGPEEFFAFQKNIRIPDGAETHGYAPGFRVREYENAKASAVARKRSGRMQSNGVVEWKERGPNNVPGRTRGLIVDPDDPAKNTWYAGSVGGGVWKTTNGGTNWTLITPDLPNLATTVLVMAESNHDIIYLGTGEGFGNLDGISGSGMFKSTDRGQTWTYLPATSNFGDINRAIVDPDNANIVVVATNSGIYRTVNGGTGWSKVSDRTWVQDLKATPGNFNIQYATQRFVGVIKSTDAGQTWNLSTTGLTPSPLSGQGRVEIAVSPVNTNRIFASTQGNYSGTESDLYVSEDAGNLWVPVNVVFNNENVDFLGGQGWYDNTIACDPFNADIVYFGGVNLFRSQLSGTSTVTSYGVQDETGFLSLVNFSASQYGGRLEIGTGANKSVEVRFGNGKSQFAHRFTVPANGGTNGDGGAGIPDNNYTYQNYVEVPFEVWEVDNQGNDVRQLMISFRDQQRDGQFNLNVRDDVNDPQLLTAREYIYIHYLTYQETPAASIMVNGGQTVQQMYFFWPTLASGTWNPATLPNVKLKIIVGNPRNATTVTVSDAYGQFDSKNRFVNYGVDFHPDQHNLVMIPMSGNTFKILSANDGGVFVSNTSSSPGINNGDWSMRGKTYNTGQFYGADKRPGVDEYIGGMQDNGTWKSPANQSATSSSNYIFNIGGDGFEVLWHNLDDQKIIGGSQGNSFRRSTNGGGFWTNATTGLSGNHPFISKLANSRHNPDRIYTLSSAGVFYSTNFGESWTLTPITQKWGSSTSLMDVEVSRADANIVWAGSGMTADRNIHVSTNAGLSFTPANNSTLISGGITKLASHPHEPNTAYVLFSQAGNPKILRTTDLGQTWEDISGFGNGDVSINGFPDVAVYCLYVRPDNPDIIWAGTEIGIVESLDNGQNWALLEDFPSVAVWDMKGQDDQVIIATHGRGIWTATIEASQISGAPPEIIAYGTSPKEKLVLKVKSVEAFDRIDFYEGNTFLGTIEEIEPSELIVEIGNLAPGNKNIKMVSYRGESPYHSKTYPVPLLDILTVENSYGTYFNSTSDLTVNGFVQQKLSDASTSERSIMQTSHPYGNNQNYTLLIRHPIRVAQSEAIIQYEDIAIVEPGTEGSVFGTPDFKDFVVVEATKNGLDWVPLAPGYDARANASWLSAFTNAAPGTKSMLTSHTLDMHETFQAGDTLLIRYRLNTNSTVASWGCAVNYILIQQAPTGIESESSGLNGLVIYPNPATDQTQVKFTLVRSGNVVLESVDATGRKIKQRNLGMLNAGEHTVNLDVSEFKTGNYVIHLKTPDGNKTGRLIITN
jgi:photosystem II stability/assembly factor-like uncharacterized protein